MEQSLRDRVLSLTTEERRELAFELLASTQGAEEATETSSAEIEQEIERRLAAHPPGTPGVPWEMVRQMMRNLGRE